MREEPLYWESQRIPFGTTARVLVPVAGLVLWVAAKVTGLEGNGDGAVAAVTLCSLGGAYALALLPFVGSLRTVVRDRRLELWIGLWPIPTVIRLRRVGRARVVALGSASPLPFVPRNLSATIDGPTSGSAQAIGMRVRSYRAGGDRGVNLRMDGGACVVIGSRTPEDLVRALGLLGVPADGEPPKPLEAPAYREPTTLAPPPSPRRRPAFSRRSLRLPPALYEEAPEDRSPLAWPLVVVLWSLAAVVSLIAREELRSGTVGIQWYAVPAGAVFLAIVTWYLIAPTARVVVTEAGLAAWFGSGWLSWARAELAQSAPVVTADVVENTLDAGGPASGRAGRFATPVGRLTGDRGVAVVLTNGSQVLVPSRDPHALCRALGSIGVEVVTAEELRQADG